MPLLISGELAPSGGPGSFDLYNPQDIKTGNVDVVLQAIAGGAFKGGVHATAPAGEVVPGVRTDAGLPSHSASRGTVVWSVADGRFYVNTDGATAWIDIPNAADFSSLDGDITAHAALTAAHGATGAVVGTTNTQTLLNKSIGASQIDSGTLATARLGSGTADATTFLRGDQTWASAGTANLILAGQVFGA